MAKIFISYSSKDKEFVNKIAFDLLSGGLPIWLDSWEIELGDSLYQKIFTGLDSSSYVIVVVSKNYNKSIWTSKEFRSVLAKEDRENRKILIPILIDEFKDVPLEIADRLYTDFAIDYESKLLQLTRFFRRNDVTVKQLPIFQRLIPVSFDNYVHLDKQILIKILDDLDYLDDTEFSKKNVWIKDSEFFDRLLRLSKEKIKDHQSDQNLNEQFKRDLDTIETLIDQLHTGIITILNAYRKNANLHLSSNSIYWTYKGIIGNIYSIFSRYIDFNKDLNISLPDVQYSPFSSSIGFCEFYDVKGFRHLDLFDPKNRSVYFPFFIDENNYASKQFNEITAPDPLSTFWDYDLIYKYLIPQNTLSYLNGNNYPLMTKFEEYHLGLH